MGEGGEWSQVQGSVLLKQHVHADLGNAIVFSAIATGH